MTITETHRLPLISFTIRVWFADGEQKQMSLSAVDQEAAERRTRELFPHATHWDAK